MGTGHFSDQAVGSQQAELASQRRRLASPLGGAGRRVAVQERAKVPVAEAVQEEFAPADRLQQRRILTRERLQCPDPPATAKCLLKNSL